MTPYGYPSDAYHCLLDEQPHYLVPPRLFLGDPPSDALMVNPKCWFSWLGPLPPDQAARAVFADSLHPAEWMVWVEDGATGALWPYWLGSTFAAWCNGLTPGSPLGRELPENIRWVLWQAGVLVPVNHSARRRREWLESLAKYATAFERGYVAVPGMIPAFHVGALRRYYRARTRTGDLLVCDDQAGKRFYSHNEAVARFFHHQLATAVSDIARALIKPSYAFAVSYQSGSMLDTHTDREQCEYSVTYCYDATPDPESQSPWPLQLDTAEGRLKIWQHLGDGLVYRGRYIPHTRDPLPIGHTSSSLLFHYVDESFNGSLD